MTSRERFEHQCRNGLVNGGLAVFENGVYVSELTRAVWSGWQSSREEIVVDLSKMHLLLCDQNDVVSELTKHGLKVKV